MSNNPLQNEQKSDQIEIIINNSEIICDINITDPEIIIEPVTYDITANKPEIIINLNDRNSDLENIILNQDITQKNFIDKFKDLLQDENFQQRLNISSTILVELYRMITSSLLILFIPQSCHKQLCTISENLYSKQKLYNAGLAFNFLTLFTFTMLYAIEIKRENRLIKYLSVNQYLPNSNEDVEKTLEHIPYDKKNKILSIDKSYQMISYTSICMFTINSILSGIIVNKYYLGSQTNVSLFTSILFMATKLISIYNIANTAKNIFYSAYLKSNVQFNDLDKKYKIII